MRSRCTAAVAGLALAGLGLIAAAPPAGAATTTPTVTCVLPAGQGTFTGPQDVTVSLDKTTVAPGGVLTGAVTLGKSPAISTVSMTIYATPTITLAMRGAATGEVTITGAEQIIPVVKDESPPIAPYSGTFSVPVSAATGGKIEFTVVKMVTDTRLGPGGGAPLPTVCTVVEGGDAAVAEVGVDGGTVEPATLDAPSGVVRPGQAIDLTGSKFTPNAKPQVSLCDGDGTNCAAGRFTGDTLGIDAQGNLTGSATLAKTGLANGTYVVRVFDGAKEGRDDLTIESFVPTEPRTLHVDPASGPLGTIVTVTGTNWTPNASVNVVQTEVSGVAGPGTIVISTDPLGSFTTPYTVTSPYTTQIRAREGISSVKRLFTPFTVTGPAPLKQDASATLAPGSLTMSQAGTGIDFGSATLNGEAQTLNANLNQVTVLDTRGGNLGWSLTGTMTDLTAANSSDKIPAGNIAWTPNCVASAASLSTVTNGTPGALGSTPAALCSVTATGATTGGSFTADAQLTLTTPQFAAAGAYAGTLTLTLA